MENAALSRPEHEDESVSIDAAFMRNHRGAVCIAFSDPAYVRSDSIVVDRDSCAIHCILHEARYPLGHVSEAMVRAFAENHEALLTAIRPDGTVFELLAPVQVH